MKKKTVSNLIMVGIIAVIAVAGILCAYFLMDPGANASLGSSFHPAKLKDEQGEYTCTVMITCSSVLGKTDRLNQAKAPYIPADGIILQEITVSFTPGETAFDVLNRLCEKADIQLEYSWTPIYDSYYVEGISHLYEFDCGPESGWMYQVNGKFPNYGSSSYQVQDQDNILWIYSCDGLGTDVGAERME